MFYSWSDFSLICDDKYNNKYKNSFLEINKLNIILDIYFYNFTIHPTNTPICFAKWTSSPSTCCRSWFHTCAPWPPRYYSLKQRKYFDFNSSELIIIVTCNTSDCKDTSQYNCWEHKDSSPHCPRNLTENIFSVLVKARLYYNIIRTLGN